MKKVFIETLLPEGLEVEDGGLYKGFVVTGEDSTNNGMYVRVCSWDEEEGTHEEFNHFVGRKVKVTIETIDDED
jgi:hypothetical protein